MCYIIISTGRFCGVEDILEVYADERLLMAATISAIMCLATIPLASVPVFVTQSNLPLLLCYYLNEQDVIGLWSHSLSYWVLICLDGLWLYMILTFNTFVVLMLGHVGCGTFFMLKTLR